MLEIKKYLIKINFRKGVNKKNLYIGIHYTANNGDTALNNCKYFEKIYRGASANYFVDENEIYQCVEDSDVAWHVGAKKYYNNCRNDNSIGIEMCSRKKNGVYYIKQETVDNTAQLTADLMLKYNIPIENVVRHYDVTHKVCPEPFVRDETAWKNFIEDVKRRIDMNEYEALDYLVEKGRITDKEYWLSALKVVKNQKYLIIKWAEDVKRLESL